MPEKKTLRETFGAAVRKAIDPIALAFFTLVEAYDHAVYGKARKQRKLEQWQRMEAQKAARAAAEPKPPTPSA